jgi:general secretion pathway protein L
MKALFFIEIPTHAPTEQLSYHWYKKELESDSYGDNLLAELKLLSLNCDVVLVLPGFNVTLKKISSKVRNRKKLEFAIGYELEEVLAEEIETLFFAYQSSSEANVLDIAIINRAWFEKWLEVFKQLEIPLSAVITDTLLLPTIMQPFLLIEKSDYFLLKTPMLSYTIDNENIDYFLNQLKDSLPEELEMMTANPLKDWQSYLSESNLKLKPLQTQDCVLKLLTEHYFLEKSFNLLQGEYKPKLKNDWQKIQWSVIGVLGLLLIATSFQAYQHWQLSNKEAELDQQRLKLFQTNFPAIKKIVNPVAQMKNQLEILKQAQQQQGQFIAILAKVSVGLKALIAEDKAHLLGVEFDNNVLILKVNANSFALIEQIKQSLAAQQLVVEIESSDKAENQVIASFKVSGALE